MSDGGKSEGVPESERKDPRNHTAEQKPKITKSERKKMKDRIRVVEKTTRRAPKRSIEKTIKGQRTEEKS